MRVVGITLPSISITSAWQVPLWFLIFSKEKRQLQGCKENSFLSDSAVQPCSLSGHLDAQNVSNSDLLIFHI